MSGKKAIGIIFGALLVLSLASPCWADDVTVKCTVARLIHYGFERIDGTVSLSHNGTVTSQTITNGQLTVQIARSGATVMTISGSTIVDRQFTFSFDSEGNMDLFGPVGERLTPGLRPDGAYYFDYMGSNVVVFDQAGEDDILMGFTRDRNRNRTWGNATIWNQSPRDHIRMWRWEATNGQVPGLVRKWMQPDGSYTHRFYPLGQDGIDADGNYFYAYNDATSLHFYWRLDLHYNQAFFDSLQAGTHTIQYWFATTEGTRSNVRTETIVVAK